ncbi:hypothetical protein OKA05_09125 [Luteolibacter arcticus]|uniref:DUF4178 domain-containing protein n=1 Tax=Luteolibacter arcticus TaxID=1581411 RepID=A0ABT3GHG4_9BACT|nr:hypothetical protein [Luteolibacter arcticus]MCW1922713.1 hypothetical protein [Luteolibacter arcticus]
MSDTVTTARRWNSFVCPGCRCVFRVPQDHDGTGVVCPACRVMLRLPGPDDELPPLISASAALAKPVDAGDYDDEDMDSDEAVTAARSDRNFIAILVMAAVVLVGIVAWWIMPEKKPVGPVVEADTPVQPAPQLTPAATPGGGTAVEPPKPLLVEIESVVKAFLDAPTREEALAQVLDPAATALKWDAWLAGKSYVAPGFQGVLGESKTTGTGEGAVSLLHVRIGDYTFREIALIKRDGRLKVDWESWAGWSEMSWQEFRKKKPVEPTLFRVQLSRVEYFNFAFTDDREWSSYRLDSPDGVDSIYGYVPRNGLLDQRLRPVDANAKPKWLLKLKFPRDATQDSQVLIDSVVDEGWVMPQNAGE